MNKNESSNSKIEEIIAGAGGFIYAGYSILSGGLPDNLFSWFKLIGVFLVISLVVYGFVYLIRKLNFRSI